MRLRLAVVGSTLAAVGLVPAGTAGAWDRCDKTTPVYVYCGEHVPGDLLPLKFSVSRAVTGPISAADLLRIASDAALEWNRAWGTVGGLTAAAGPDPDCVVRLALCILPGLTTNAGTDRDGKNTIAWRNGLGGRCGSDPSAIAVACLFYSDGASGHRIVEVDIYLNAAKTWRSPSSLERVVGEAEFLSFGPPTPLCLNPFIDAASAITHELGHALGLEHVASNFPVSFTGITSVRQTMFDTYLPCATYMRTPEEGDLLGLQLAAADSAKDR